MPKKHVLTPLLPCFKVKVKDWGEGQRSWSRPRVKVKGQISGDQQSILGARLWRVQKSAVKVITSLGF